MLCKHSALRTLVTACVSEQYTVQILADTVLCGRRVNARVGEQYAVQIQCFLCAAMFSSARALRKKKNTCKHNALCAPTNALVGGVLCEHSIICARESALVGEGAYSLDAGECSRWRGAV